MAIVQISRIQVRRGLHQDLPQLAAGEFGWSIGPTTPRLWIGNGTLEEGAPIEGRTEILTEYSDFLGFLTAYTFKGIDATGYASITGTSVSDPVTRSLQSVLDEGVSVKHFGAKGDGVTNDAAAINRAIQQIYVSTYANTLPAFRRTIRFPAGVYNVGSSTILIPPNCRIIGEGKNNTIISGTGTVAKTCDSQYQYTTVTIGNGGADLPQYITVSDVGFTTSSSVVPPVEVEKATDIIFDKVKFTGGNYGLNILGTSSNIDVFQSTFTGATTGTISIASTVTGVVTKSNYFDTVRVPLSLGSNSITTLANGAGKIDYEITSGTNYRIGTLKYNRSGGVLTFDDEYNEPSTSIGANLYASSNGTLTCTVSSVAVLKYNIKQFI